MTNQSFSSFAPGDLFVPAPQLDPEARFPTGMGIIRQYDGDFNLKAEVATGRRGLISALAIGPDGVLYALDPQARAHDRFGPDGRPLPPLPLPDAGFGSMLFESGGTLLLGEHLCGAPGPFGGRGQVYRITTDGRELQRFDTQTNGGVSGFLGVTHMALSGDGATLFHLSETGPHIYAHDLVTGEQRGIFHTRAQQPPMLFGLATLPDGQLAVATGGGLQIIGPDGQVAADVALPPGRGWANVIVRPGGNALIVVDFFGGQLAELALPDFRLLRRVELGNPKGLTSIAEAR